MGSAKKAFEGMNLGLRTGAGVMQDRARTQISRERLEFDKQRYSDLKAKDNLLSRVNARKNDIAAAKVLLDQKKMVVDLLPSLMGEEGITPKRKDAITKSIKDQLGFDISVIFRPDVNDDGVTESFSLHDKESLNNKLKAENEAVSVAAEKTNAAANMLEADIKKERLDKKIYDDPLEFLTATFSDSEEYKNSSVQEKINMVAKANQGFDAPMSAREGKLGKAAITEVEENLISYAKKIKPMTTIVQNYADEFLQYEGKIKKVVLDIIDGSKLLQEHVHKLTPEEKGFIERYTRFDTNVRSMHSQYVHDMSGAQVSVKEMDRRLKEMFNVKMKPTAFKAAFNDYREHVQKMYRTMVLVKSQGMTDKNEIGQQVDKLMNIPVDPTQDKEHVTSVYNELKRSFEKQGVSDPVLEASLQLRKMGYTR